MSSWPKMDGTQFFWDEAKLPDIKTTCRLFHEASLIVGVHGAGISNMVCSKPGTQVVELWTTDKITCFQVLAGVIGAGHHGIDTQIPHGIQLAAPEMVHLPTVSSAIQNAKDIINSLS